jgi:hypothetical protein
MNHNDRAVIGLVKAQLQQALNGLIGQQVGPQQVQVTVQSMLSSMQLQDTIRGYQVHATERSGVGLFREVALLAPGASPGDPYVVNDEYRGMVVSVNETGGGFVLAPEGSNIHDEEIKITCDVQLSARLEYVRIEAVIRTH